MLNASVRRDIAELTPLSNDLSVLPRMTFHAAWAASPFDVLDMRPLSIAAAGSERDVYLHPADSSLLIKIIRNAAAKDERLKLGTAKRSKSINGSA